LWLWSRSNGGHGRPPTNANMDSGFGVKTLLYGGTKSTTDRPLLPRPSPSFAGIVQYYGRERHDISHCWTTWVMICSSYGRSERYRSAPHCVVVVHHGRSRAAFDCRTFFNCAHQNAAGETPTTRVFTAEEYILARERQRNVFNSDLAETTAQTLLADIKETLYTCLVWPILGDGRGGIDIFNKKREPTPVPFVRLTCER
jgi:hypothetical protein